MKVAGLSILTVSLVDSIFDLIRTLNCNYIWLQITVNNHSVATPWIPLAWLSLTSNNGLKFKVKLQSKESGFDADHSRLPNLSSFGNGFMTQNVKSSIVKFAL